MFEVEFQQVIQLKSGIFQIEFYHDCPVQKFCCVVFLDWDFRNEGYVFDQEYSKHRLYSMLTENGFFDFIIENYYLEKGNDFIHQLFQDRHQFSSYIKKIELFSIGDPFLEEDMSCNLHFVDFSQEWERYNSL